MEVVQQLDPQPRVQFHTSHKLLNRHCRFGWWGLNMIHTGPIWFVTKFATLVLSLVLKFLAKLWFNLKNPSTLFMSMTCGVHYYLLKYLAFGVARTKHLPNLVKLG